MRNREKASLDAILRAEQDKTKVHHTNVLFTSFCVGSIAATFFVFLKFGVLYRFEGTYLFYGIIFILFTIKLFMFRKSRLLARIIYTVFAFILITVVAYVILTEFVGKNRIDLRRYLASDTTSILHKYRSDENHWNDVFLDPNGYVYYSNVAESDVSRLTNLKRTEIWIDWDRTGLTDEKADWHTYKPSLDHGIPEKYIILANHPDTLCSSYSGILCVNKTTREVAFIYF